MRRATDLAELEVTLKSTLLSSGIVSQRIIVYDSQVLVPGEAVSMFIKIGSQRMGKVLLAELVDSGHFSLDSLFIIIQLTIQ